MNMHGFVRSLTPDTLLFIRHFSSRSFLILQKQANFSIPSFRYCQGGGSGFAARPFAPALFRYYKRRNGCTILRASWRESPYEVLGVSPFATPDEIKRAYRKLDLKYHPDVNKEANLQEKFMRIKHAYNTLLNSEFQRRYKSGNRTSDFSYSGTQRSQSTNAQDEEFYGFGDKVSIGINRAKTGSLCAKMRKYASSMPRHSNWMPRHWTENASWMPRHPKRMLRHTGGGRVRDGDTRAECRGIQNGCRGMRGQRRNLEGWMPRHPKWMPRHPKWMPRHPKWMPRHRFCKKSEFYLYLISFLN